MKYTLDIEIDKSIDKVWTLSRDQGRLSVWQHGLVSVALQEGNWSEPGSKTELTYQMGKRRITMIETVIHASNPRSFKAQYESKGVVNNNVNSFTSLGPGKTLWRQETEFKFTGFMRIIGLLFGSSFKKQTLQTMQAFKSFAESEVNIG